MDEDRRLLNTLLSAKEDKASEIVRALEDDDAVVHLSEQLHRSLLEREERIFATSTKYRSRCTICMSWLAHAYFGNCVLPKAIRKYTERVDHVRNLSSIVHSEMIRRGLCDDTLVPPHYTLDEW